VLNDLENKNFNQFVNEYRVREVISFFSKEEYKHFPVLRIAFEAGFNSKSTFNEVFKKMTGKNPNQFRKEANFPSF
jgi:putative ABC transport system permease protein